MQSPSSTRARGSPGVLLAAGHPVHLMRFPVDLDRARHRQRRLRADVGDRGQSLPPGSQKWKRRLPRLPREVPAHRAALRMHLPRAPIALEPGAVDPNAERPEGRLQRSQRKSDLPTRVCLRLVAIEGESPERRLGLRRYTRRRVERRVAEPEPAAGSGVGKREVPRLIRACSVEAAGSVGGICTQQGWCLRILHIWVMPARSAMH